MKRFLRTIVSDTRGATAIEYAAIGLFIIIVCVAGFTLLGSSSNGLMSNVSTKAGARL
jgi:Flp pilus assembly pilin Flp